MGLLNRLFGKGSFVDEIEALPAPDVEFIGLGDAVLHERTNERGEVVLVVEGVVTALNYRTNEVKITVTPTLRLWVPVATVSLIVAANTAAFAA